MCHSRDLLPTQKLPIRAFAYFRGRRLYLRPADVVMEFSPTSSGNTTSLHRRGARTGGNA